MNLLYAYELAIIGADWFRPVVWVGTGKALKPDHSPIEYAWPRRMIGKKWTPTKDEIKGEWQVVHPDHVMNEFHHELRAGIIYRNMNHSSNRFHTYFVVIDFITLKNKRKTKVRYLKDNKIYYINCDKIKRPEFEDV